MAGADGEDGNDVDDENDATDRVYLTPVDHTILPFRLSPSRCGTRHPFRHLTKGEGGKRM